MTDALFSFDEPVRDERAAPPPAAMTDSQRSAIRSTFAELSITDAREQFAVIEELLGRPINNVQEMTLQSANALIPLLEARAKSSRSTSTGNAWADRTEDTWIDRL